MPRNTIAPLILLLITLLSALPESTGVARPAQANFIYLPMTSSGRNPTSVLGMEVVAMAPGSGLEDLQPAWIRPNGLLWSDVEPRRGSYSWDAPSVRSLEADLIQISAQGSEPVLVVHNSPSWAIEPGTGNCAPILPEHYTDFVRFITAAVERYSGPPYNVRYWEIGNEPDAPITAGQSPYGCWGKTDDPYYGGQAYGELLKVVYPAIKAINPQAQVLNGGLLLGRPYDAQSGKGLAGRFLEGMLVAGAGKSFDILAYHSYSYYNGTPDGTSGATDWKPAYLRAILARYGQVKPLFNTEGALLCVVSDTTCREAQANAIPRLYLRTMRKGVLGFVWYLYDNDGFHNTALVEPADPAQRRPAYQAYAQLSTVLSAYDYLSPLSNLPGEAEGYWLRRGSEQAIVVWANSSLTLSLALGEVQNLRCQEQDGAPIDCAVGADGMLTIQALPGARYVRFRQ